MYQELFNKIMPDISISQDEESLKMVVKRRLTKKELKVLMQWFLDLDKDEICNSLHLDAVRYEKLLQMALKKIKHVTQSELQKNVSK